MFYIHAHQRRRRRRRRHGSQTNVRIQTHLSIGHIDASHSRRRAFRHSTLVVKNHSCKLSIRHRPNKFHNYANNVCANKCFLGANIRSRPRHSQCFKSIRSTQKTRNVCMNQKSKKHCTIRSESQGAKQLIRQTSMTRAKNIVRMRHKRQHNSCKKGTPSEPVHIGFKHESRHVVYTCNT